MTTPTAPARRLPAHPAGRRHRPRVIVVMPAYNAARTLEKTYGDLDKNQVYEVILVDDVSLGQYRGGGRSSSASSASSTSRTGATAATRRPATWKR